MYHKIIFKPNVAESISVDGCTTTHFRAIEVEISPEGVLLKKIPKNARGCDTEIDYNNIEYCCSCNKIRHNNCCIKIKDKANKYLMVRTTVRALRKKLPKEYFLQIHHNIIVAKNAVMSILLPHILYLENMQLPIGEDYIGGLILAFGIQQSAIKPTKYPKNFTKKR